MNSRQRRTVARAKDARRPYGAAVLRERRNRKRRTMTLAGIVGGVTSFTPFSEEAKRRIMESAPK